MTISEVIMLVGMIITLVSLGWIFRGWAMFLKAYIRGDL
jgi:hypothetical protein